MLRLEIKDALSKTLLQYVIIYIADNLHGISMHMLETQELWKLLMRRYIGYPEMSHTVCSFSHRTLSHVQLEKRKNILYDNKIINNDILYNRKING
jgi:hypothetical protein